MARRIIYGGARPLCAPECPGKTGAPIPPRATAAPPSYATARVDRGVPASDEAASRGSGGCSRGDTRTRGGGGGGEGELSNIDLPAFSQSFTLSRTVPRSSLFQLVSRSQYSHRIVEGVQNAVRRGGQKRGLHPEVPAKARGRRAFTRERAATNYHHHHHH